MTWSTIGRTTGADPFRCRVNPNEGAFHIERQGRRPGFAEGECGTAVVKVVVKNPLDVFVAVFVDGFVVPVEAVESAWVFVAPVEAVRGPSL